MTYEITGNESDEAISQNYEEEQPTDDELCHCSDCEDCNPRYFKNPIDPLTGKQAPPCYECWDDSKKPPNGFRFIYETQYGIAERCNNCGFAELI